MVQIQWIVSCSFPGCVWAMEIGQARCLQSGLTLHTHTHRAFKSNNQDYLVLAAAGLGLFACLTGERRLTREDGNILVTLNLKTSQYCHRQVGLQV